MSTLDFGRQVETTMDRIDTSSEIHPDNKEALQKFKRDLSLEGLSDAWLSKLLGHLVIIAEHLENTRFEDMDEEDVKDLVEWVQSREKDNGEGLSDATISAYKQAIKRFWRWLADKPEGEHPEAVDWIHTKTSSGNGKLPKDLLEGDDVEALKDACRNPRDRAFIAMLYETGARIGELIDLTVGDIEDPSGTKGFTVVIDGKTGQRRLRLIKSYSALKSWLNDHPSGKSDAPLWCQLRDADSELSYHYIRQKLLVRAGERAAKQNPQEYAEDPDLPDEELTFYKPLNPHHFRHSRATHLASEFKEAQLCEWFGWVQGSDVPAKYVHLSGRDLDDAYGKMHGIEPEDDEEDTQTVQECWRCEEINEPDDRFCGRCGAALDEESQATIDSVDESMKQDYRDTDPEDPDTMEKLDTLDELLEDPGVKTALLEKLE